MPRVVIGASGTFSLNDSSRSCCAGSIAFRCFQTVSHVEPYIAARHRVQYHHTTKLRRMTMKKTIAILVCMIFVSAAAQAFTPPRSGDGKLTPEERAKAIKMLVDSQNEFLSYVEKL